MVMQRADNKDEATLLRNAARGDRAAFTKLVRLHMSVVVNVCYKILGNRDDAEDVAQDVFVQVFRKLKSFRGESSFRSWVLSIARNRSLNFIRDNRRYSSAETISIDAELSETGLRFSDMLPADERTQPDRIMETEQYRRVLFDSLAAIPEKYAEPFSMHKLDQVPYAEIARSLGLSLPAVESRIHRAKMMLQREIAARLKKEK